jgi:hypothetical protein
MQQYNDSDAHTARLAQVSEVVNFVTTTRNIDTDVILVGDLNMGPVSDKTFDKYPIHYSNADDAKLRNRQYETLVQGLNLTNYVLEDDLCHLLHNGSLKLKRLDLPDYKLSDTGAYGLELFS